MDAQNSALGQRDKHSVLMRALTKAASKVAFHEGNPSKSGSKYGPGDKSGKYKESRHSSDKDSKHNRGQRGQEGTTPPSYAHWERK